jgi:hypothetical protein
LLSGAWGIIRIFTAVIWGKAQGKFGTPEPLKGKRVCVSGQIEEYRGVPRIVLHEVDQLGKDVD